VDTTGRERITVRINWGPVRLMALRSGDAEEKRRKKQMFPQGAFVKMYYFAIDAHNEVGYTLAALRCGKKRSVTI
jgi:hypothetical protein